MKPEDKELLLKDLCARLPYGVKALYYGSEEEMLTVDTIEAIYTQPSVEIVIGQYGLELDDVKPYLRSMSSMTEEEQKEFVKFHCVNICPIVITEQLTISNEVEMFDWLNKKMFDCRGLIPKELAIKVTEENNPYKE